MNVYLYTFNLITCILLYNIKDFFSDEQLKLLFNHIYSFGYIKNNNYPLEKSEFFYNIPIKFKNTSWLISKRLNLTSFEIQLESLFTYYISNYNNYKDDVNNFLNKTNPLLLKNPLK